MSEQIITKVYRNGLTDLPIGQDLSGMFHVIPGWQSVIPPSVGNRIYIQAVSHGTFPDTDNFYSIPNELTGEPDTKYTVPTDKSLNIFFLMASQDLLPKGGKKDKKDKEGLEMALLGIFLNGSFVMCLPYKHDMHYVLAETLRFHSDAEIEIKVRPCSTRTRVAVLAGGYLMENEI